MIGIHPERVADDERAVRWVVPPGRVPCGRVLRAPGTLGVMLRDGTLSGALVEHTAVWLWLRDGLSWGRLGTSVRSALQDALADPQGWVAEPAPGEVLERVTADLLSGPVGEFIRSHGGSVTVDRNGDTVVVRLGGACEHCPAAEYTLRLRLLDALRRRCPELIECDGGPGAVRVSLR